jgi:hypothetical protein
MTPSVIDPVVVRLLNVVEEDPPSVIEEPERVTVPVPPLNVPPLFVQLPATFMAVAVPALSIPAVSVKSPFTVSVAVLPETPSVFEALFTVRLLKVWDAALPLIDCAPVPLKVTAPVPGVKVPPLLVQLPAALMVAPAVNVPAVSVTFPFTVSVAGAEKLPVVSVQLFTVNAVVLPPTLKVCPAVLATVTLKNVCEAAVPWMDCAPVPLKLTVFPAGVNVPPLFVQFPLTLIWLPSLTNAAPASIWISLYVLLLVKVPACTSSRELTVSVLPVAVTPPVPEWFTVTLLNVVVPVNV